QPRAGGDNDAHWVWPEMRHRVDHRCVKSKCNKLPVVGGDYRPGLALALLAIVQALHGLLIAGRCDDAIDCICRQYSNTAGTELCHNTRISDCRGKNHK